MSVASLNPASPPPFVNEPYADFSQPRNRAAMEACYARCQPGSCGSLPSGLG